MNDNLTDINVVLDRSGSMASVLADTIGGFNSFLKAQKEAPGDAFLTLAQFDDRYEVVHNGVAVKDVPELTTETFVPRGMTALLDAIGKTINTTGERLAKLTEDERPGKVIFVVLTDGGENSSNEFNNQQIKDMIKHQTDTYTWDFVFIGAGQDAVTTGGTMGFMAGNSLNIGSQGVAHASAYTTISEKMTMYRSGSLGCKGPQGATGDAGTFFDQKDRDEQSKLGAQP